MLPNSQKQRRATFSLAWLITQVTIFCVFLVFIRLLVEHVTRVPPFVGVIFLAAPSLALLAAFILGRALGISRLWTYGCAFCVFSPLLLVLAVNKETFALAFFSVGWIPQLLLVIGIERLEQSAYYPQRPWEQRPD